nr:MAG: RNA-dependent RNA polymerase [Guiyang mito-like virus 1]
MDQQTAQKLVLVKVQPVSAGHRHMINTPWNMKMFPGHTSALLEYTDTMFNHIPKSSNAFFEHAMILVQSQGKKTACSVLKEYYRVASLAAWGLPYQVDQSGTWIAWDKDGFPKRLRSFKRDLSNGTISEKRAVLTVLACFRLIRWEPVLDLDTIVKSSSSKQPGHRLRRLFTQACSKLQSKIGEDVPMDTALHISSSKGPNGPSLETCVSDATALYADKNLLEAIEVLNSSARPSGLVCDIEYGRGLFKTITYDYTTAPLEPRSVRRAKILREALNRIDESTNPVHSRIATLSTGACKTRTVAMCDWFTQDALKPIHEWAYRSLSKIRQDGTYSHNNIAKLAKRLNGAGLRAWWFDLSAATDRFPALLQRDLLKQILGEPIAQAWYTLISRREFVHKGHSGIVYAVGQPMGALSSWAVFSLSHHVIVQMAAIAAGVTNPKGRWFAKYIMIGDDIAIFHKDVARLYTRILKRLDVPFNLAKSLVPPPEGVGAVEIAKRTFIKGQEISPCPPDLIVQARKDANIFPLLILLSQQRDIALATERSPVKWLLSKWYQPSTQERVELVLYDPTGNRALLRDPDDLDLNLSTPDGVNFMTDPWKAFSKEDIEDEVYYALWRRVKNKTQQLASRLDKLTTRETTGQPLAEMHRSKETKRITDLPVELLAKHLRIVCTFVSDPTIQSSFKNESQMIKNLETLDLALSALDAYRSRRLSHTRSRLVGKVLADAYKFVKEVKDLGFGNDEDDW